MKNRSFDFWGSKYKISKIRDFHLAERVICHLLVLCWLRFILKSFIPEALECWPFFYPKSRDITSLKRHFLKNFSTDFSEILNVDKILDFLRCQIDAKEGAISFASISAHVFKLLKKFAVGALYAPQANGGLTVNAAVSILVFIMFRAFFVCNRRRASTYEANQQNEKDK